MRQVYNNKIIIDRLVDKIESGIKSALIDYRNLYTSEEINQLMSGLKLIESRKISDNIFDVFKLEDSLKELIFRCWQYELDKGSRFISWLKEDKIKDGIEVISSTFGDTETPFCGSPIGISYDVSIDGFLGACSKDAATVISDKSQESFYTIGHLQSGKVVNSFNLATTIITPHQAYDKSNNDYLSKHNEIILDTRYIKPKEIVCLDEEYIEFAEKLSDKYNIPIDCVYEEKQSNR